MQYEVLIKKLVRIQVITNIVHTRESKQYIHYGTSPYWSSKISNTTSNRQPLPLIIGIQSLNEMTKNKSFRTDTEIMLKKFFSICILKSEPCERARLFEFPSKLRCFLIRQNLPTAS